MVLLFSAGQIKPCVISSFWLVASGVAQDNVLIAVEFCVHKRESVRPRPKRSGGRSAALVPSKSTEHGRTLCTVCDNCVFSKHSRVRRTFITQGDGSIHGLTDQLANWSINWYTISVKLRLHLIVWHYSTLCTVVGCPIEVFSTMCMLNTLPRMTDTHISTRIHDEKKRNCNPHKGPCESTFFFHVSQTLYNYSEW